MKRFFPAWCVAPALATLFGFGLSAAERAIGYPKPSPVIDSWQLDIELNQPRVISVQTAGEQGPRLYYYVTYTVTNYSGRDVMFLPRFTMLTDQGHLLDAGQRVPPAIFDAIDRRLGNPLLVPPFQAAGILLQGRNNARTSVAIWPVPGGEDIDLMRIFISGLSGEVRQVTDALGRTHRLRKTLMLEYRTPGGRAYTAAKPFLLQEKKWILR